MIAQGQERTQGCYCCFLLLTCLLSWLRDLIPHPGVPWPVTELKLSPQTFCTISIWSPKIHVRQQVQKLDRLLGGGSPYWLKATLPRPCLKPLELLAHHPSRGLQGKDMGLTTELLPFCFPPALPWVHPPPLSWLYKELWWCQPPQSRLPRQGPGTQACPAPVGSVISEPVPRGAHHHGTVWAAGSCAPGGPVLQPVVGASRPVG